MHAPARFAVEDAGLPPDRGLLTVDFENWHHRSCVPQVEYLLEVFDERGVSATFFVVGSRARGMAETVRAAHERGHEIASHGWVHRHLREQTPRGFREDVRRSLDELSGITGAPVRGFRAPFFSVTADTMWALEILAELGLAYDSSVFPIAGRRCGIAGFPRHPVRLTCDGMTLLEVPPSTVVLAGRGVPVAGGGYLRVLPTPAIKTVVARVRREGRPFVAYFHPYEFAPERLRHDREQYSRGRLAARLSELKTNLGRATMRVKLVRLLDECRFTSIARSLDHAD